MNLLTLDTSTEYLSLALQYKGETLLRDWHAQQKHAEMTLPQIQQLLADAGASLQDLDGIALSIGPGSFTGLRIGCGIVQGLAFGLDIPTLGVNTLAALAADSEADHVLSVLDARMGELYLAGYQRNNGEWQEVLATRVCGPQALPDLPDTGWQGLGSGFAVQGEALQARYGSQLQAVDANRFPHASGVLKLAQAKFEAGLAVPAHLLELLYIRDKVALKTNERTKA
ncbi:tRNA (adenosine(37)-N6)-threonylcarbamoyltransferase complex dimerization subunit type 1 TsaB [Chitinimonas sp. BJB300]|uniref:tRNA (adenosine(37)-N6)-threonylcarbamoyltransferase complex dimerization subunit type 1 TsaB n=1 Tax=Chitinimonas sp. BJB300 TaxID=1559339 RepID=UPI000C0D8785|nr:tRNA (adenosine(37)-N6)-threonylcarbamoyltransferase complex dimerization subunit type 1 TsaB [Chitinimonas sp. BJB300]PHV11535.1 tRNA (adenosine(37)-N6)-threonylcarbamoyltransferase complex dimerization subunit type 1 TsaB [Chitinimonas sp. BJB300]TSJ87243.1 tRNA (adenosine(37)-N6)-threonylcarbamoyltransferase complex dimerization subunit type 1 TsaB [Chitinimonas sp. BJB300]